ncbi:hypothetical protein F5Y03DRAFT_399760 [Xylaria venustula]|nr:hypothetical protein F5Y03DRAFT_399760 [Xylaria venustula]
MDRRVNRRNHQCSVARMTTFLQDKIRTLTRANKEELLVQAALQDFATGGDILQTAIPYRNTSSKETTDNSGQDQSTRAERMVREALSYLPNRERDELLLAAGLRNDATRGSIIRAAMGTQAGGNGAGNGQNN